MELEEYFKYIDNHFYHDLSNNFFEKFKHVIPKEIVESNPETIKTFVFLDEFYKSKPIHSSSRFEFEYRKKLEVIWHYKISDMFGEESFSVKFNFWLVGYINKTHNNYFPEILDEKQLHLKEMQEIRLKTMDEYGIKSLVTYNDGKEDALSMFSTVCRNVKNGKVYDDFHKALDIMYINRDNAYLIADLMTFSPYVFDFTEDKQHFNGKVYFRYFPSFYDQQYYFISSNFIQSTYNYWDKLGGVINHFFPSKLKKQQVFFPKVIEVLSEKFKGDFDFEWLLKFKENEYETLNDKRRQIVHYEGLEAKFMKEYTESNSDEAQIIKLQKDKSGLIDYFKNLHEMSIAGFEHMLKFIENNCK